MKIYQTERYLGIDMAQISGTKKVFQSFFNQEKFECIIELGTGIGGFTCMMFDISKVSDFHSFDHDLKKMRPAAIIILNDHIKLYEVDIFSQETIQVISELVSRPHVRVLFLCDNGNKSKEIQVFSRFLKPNDVIMAHDYAENKTDNIYIKRTTTPECIAADFENKSLLPYYDDLFKKVYWGCRIKE